MTDTTYKIHTKCTNCGTSTVVPGQMLEIPLGTTIIDALMHKRCDYCGCKKLTENKGY